MEFVDDIKGYINENKKKMILFMVIGLCFIMATIFVYNDYFLYDKTIAKVVQVENTFDHYETDEEGNKEAYYMQNITAIIKNGEYKGQEVLMTNKYSYSGVRGDRYKKGNDLFINLKADDNNLSATISSVKRDKYVVILSAIFIMLMIMVSGRKGILAIVSVLINISLYYYALELYSKGTNILSLCNILIIAFSICSLLLVSRINRQAITAIISTLLSMGVIVIIYKLAMTFGEQPEYMMMEYISSPDDLQSLFMTGVLIGCLGAIMDVSISIAVAVNELINKDYNISVKALSLSIKEIGYDIMGTMINVLFFNYMCGTIPMMVIKLRNGYSMATILKFQIPFEIIRFLVGGIGIILTIPIAGFVSVLIMKLRGKRND